MKPLPPDLSEKIDEIKSWLFYGDMKEVAKRARAPLSYVSRVLNKKTAPTKRILDSAIEIMNENKSRFEC